MAKIILIALLLMLPVQAQNDDPTEYFLSAYNSMFTVDSFYATSYQITDQNMVLTDSDTPYLVNFTRSIDGQLSNTTETSYLVVSENYEYENDSYSDDVTYNYEVVTQDNTVYVRYKEELYSYPEGWFNMNEYFQEYAIDDSYLATTYQHNFFGLMELEPRALMDIQEMGREMLHGQAMRVFHIQIDPQVIVEIMMENMGSQENINWETYLDSAYLIQYVWIGVEDHLVHRIDNKSVYNFNLDGAAGYQTKLNSMSVTFFSKFNEPLNIPEVEIGE